MPDPECVWIEDRAWKVLPEGHGQLCRMTACRAAAVAQCRRRDRRTSGGWRWWPYCPDHLYGRHVEGGRVLCRVHPESTAARRGFAEGDAKEEGVTSP